MKRNYQLEQYVLVGALIALFIWVTLPVFTPICLGLFIAMVLAPWQRRLLEQNRKHPVLVAVLMTSATLILILLPILYIGAVVVQDASHLADYLVSLTSPDSSGDQMTVNGFLQKAYEQVPSFLNVSRDTFENTLRRGLAASGAVLGKILGAMAKSLPQLFFDLLFVIISLFYGLLDGHRISRFARDTLPFPREDVETIITTSEQIIRGVVVGSLIAGACQGLVITIGFWALDVPRPIFFGMMTLIFSFVPVLGSLPAGGGAAIYLFVTGRPIAGFVMIGVLMIASASDNIVKPLALKGESELHPLIGLAAVLGGLGVFGFAGLFLGPLIVALAIVAFEMLRVHRQPDAVHQG